MNSLKQKMGMALVLSLTLGLAPFTPEPHIVGKVKWVFGGGAGMQPMDYFDLVLHGFPWIYLLITIVAFTKSKVK